MENYKLGLSAEQILEYKSKKIAEISQIITNSEVELEGLTYWSISDTLDHNLQRTNQNTWKDNLPRDTATTRYAGLYSFTRERQILFSEQKIGKATINTSTAEKDKIASNIKRDVYTMQEAKEEKN